MKEYTITVDTGTTNTRVILWNSKREMMGMSKSEVGVRVTAIEGNNESLKKAVRGCMDQVLAKEGAGFEDVSRVIASGMITSNVGLVEIPHVPAPAGPKELAEHAVEVLLEDVCPVPFLFIPGVKNRGDAIDLENFESMDIMRGEEVETAAIMHHFETGKPYLLVLPGSHTKFVAVDREGRISGCLTTITGELLSVITNNTLIADAVGHQFAGEDTYDREMVLSGFRTASKTGIGRACFSARILNMFAEPDKQKIANYVLGAVLQNDLEAVKNSSTLKTGRDTTVVVSGKNPLRRALMDLFCEDGYFAHVEEFVPEEGFPLSAEGAYLVADMRK